VRALSPGSFPSDTLTVEACAASCAGYLYFGVEYGRECYCGDSLGFGAVLANAGECNVACAGNPGEFCGGGNRLNVYDRTATTCANDAIRDPSFEDGQPTQGNPPWTPIDINPGGAVQYDFANTAVPPGPHTGAQYGSILFQNGAYNARYTQPITVCANTQYQFSVVSTRVSTSNVR
jgi:hypothetical protein